MELLEDQVVGDLSFWSVSSDRHDVFFRKKNIQKWFPLQCLLYPHISLVGLRSETVLLWDPVEQYMEVGKHQQGQSQ